MNAQSPIVKTAEKEAILRKLAQDIAKNIEDIPDILKKHGLSDDDYGTLEQSSVFKKMLLSAIQEWESATNTTERIKLKSALLVERALPDMFPVLTDAGETLSGRVELLKTLAKLGGLGNAPLPQQGDGSVFRLEINLGAAEKSIVLEHQPLLGEVEPPSMEFDEPL